MSDAPSERALADALQRDSRFAATLLSGSGARGTARCDSDVDLPYLAADGRARHRFKPPWRDGTTDVVLDPPDFLARLAPLVPAPVERSCANGLSVKTVRVNFAFGSAKPLVALAGRFEPLVEALHACHGARAVVTGHTDDRGPAAVNRALSAERAGVIEAYLVGSGIAPSRIKARGGEDARPVADNATGTRRALNRRAEVEIAR